MGPILKRYDALNPDALVVIRGDSGFAVRGLFELVENTGHKYSIRLKANARLQSTAQVMADQVLNPARLDKRQVHYQEFMYRASSWERERRVVVKMERPAGELLFQFTFTSDQHDIAAQECHSILLQSWTHGELHQGSKERVNKMAVPTSKRMLSNSNWRCWRITSTTGFAAYACRRR